MSQIEIESESALSKLTGFFSGIAMQMSLAATTVTVRRSEIVDRRQLK